MKAMKDPIPNVRFSVAKIISKMKANIDSNILNTQLVPGLKELAND